MEACASSKKMEANKKIKNYTYSATGHDLGSKYHTTDCNIDNSLREIESDMFQRGVFGKYRVYVHTIDGECETYRGIDLYIERHNNF